MPLIYDYRHDFDEWFGTYRVNISGQLTYKIGNDTDQKKSYKNTNGHETKREYTKALNISDTIEAIITKTCPCNIQRFLKLLKNEKFQ